MVGGEEVDRSVVVVVGGWWVRQRKREEGDGGGRIEKMEYWDPLDTNIQCRSSQQGEE